MPTLVLPSLGGLAIHFGRAPWLNVLYYTDGQLGLPPNVAALYIPPLAEAPAQVRLASAAATPITVGVRQINRLHSTRLSLADPDDLPEVSVPPSTVATVHLV